MRRALARWSLVVACSAVGCSDQHGQAHGVSSVKLDLLSPAADQLGSPAAPVQAQQVTFDLQALDETGAPWTRDVSVNVFISFGGVKTGASSMCGSDDTGNLPITTLALTGGQMKGATVTLPRAYGSTAVWIDDPVSHATGASPTIYFKNPLVADVQTPPDLTANNATFCSPFNGKFIIVDHATGSGSLVVSSVFGDAFVVVDTGATTFNGVYLYAFGKPPPNIVPGATLTSFSGNVSKFLGFTELNFPLFQVSDAAPDATLLPAPIPLQLADIVNIPKLLGADASVVQNAGTICNPSPPNPNMDPNIQKTIDSWRKYNQFVIDNDGTCSAFSNFATELPAKTLGSFDPLKHVGEKVRMTGMLKNNSGQNPLLDGNGQPIYCSAANPCVKGNCVEGQCKKNAFNFWTIIPRESADVCLPDITDATSPLYCL